MYTGWTEFLLIVNVRLSLNIRPFVHGEFNKSDPSISTTAFSGKQLVKMSLLE